MLSIPSKVVESFICSQLNDHLTNQNLLSEHQWGFRTARSTEDLLLHLTESWYTALDNKKAVGILFVDFKKAFDSVFHKVLLRKLSACGITGEFHDYLANYLSGRSQITKVNGILSDSAPVEFGVPQGSILGPSCFSVNVNNMPDIGDANTELFADDSTIFTIGNTVDKVLIDLQNQLDLIAKYSRENSLTIHPEKCQILLLQKQKFIGPLPSLNINDKSIKVTDKAKCLGVVVDSKMS